MPRDVSSRLSPILCQPTLLRLELLNANISHGIAQCQWSKQCKLRCLRMESCTDEIMSKVIANALHLETLALGDEKNTASCCRHRLEGWFSRTCPLLTSLTLSNFLVHIDDLQSGLSFTPCLHHLKIINCSLKRIDGSRWEDLISSTLPVLDKFEFYTTLFHREPKEHTDTCVLDGLIAPFRTPFWTEAKRWQVICNLFLNGHTLEMYISPICMSSYTDFSVPKIMTILLNRFTRLSSIVFQFRQTSRDVNAVIEQVKIWTRDSSIRVKERDIFICWWKRIFEEIIDVLSRN